MSADRPRPESLPGLEPSHALFRALAEASAAITFVFQGNRNVYANPAAVAATGYTREELLALEFWDIIHPDSRELVRERGLARQRGEPIPPRYEVQILTKSGEARWLDFTGVVVEVEGVPAVLGTAFDITAQVEVRRALRDSQASYRRLFDSPLVCSLEATTGGEIQVANRATLDLLGFESLEQLQAEPMQARYQHPAERAALVEALRTAGRVEGHELTLLRRDGTPVRVAVSVGLEDDRMSGVMLDVTERRRLEEEALRGQTLESLGLLAGGLAHDFNNFLSAILGNLTLVGLHLPANARSREWIEQAQQACQQARALTQQLLTFSKGGAPTTRAVGVEHLLREAVEFALRGSSVACEWDLAADLPPVEVDEGQMAHVFHNLTLNAAQAMPDGGTLSVSATLVVETTPPRVAIAFADEGPGIPPEDLQRVFDPYFTTRPNGTGLGLTTAHAVVARHNGTLRAEVRRPRGARFVTELPVATPRDDVAAPRDEARSPSAVPRRRVLVMDDEPMIRRTTCEMVRELGHDAVGAADGAEAVVRFAEARAGGAPFDLVLLDLTVRGGPGGLEALERLRALDPEICAIVASGYANTSVLANPSAYGFQGRLRKPYTLEDLEREVGACLGA